MKTLLVPPTIYGGSLGDQAMIYGAIDNLPGEVRVYVPVDRLSEWEYLGPGVKLWTEPTCKGFDRIVLIGADCLDGVFGPPPLDLVEEAVRLGIPASVVSFSLAEESDANCIAWLKRLAEAGVRFVCRDPVSTKRFVERAGSEPVQGADLAFLCSPRAVDGLSLASLPRLAVNVSSHRSPGYAEHFARAITAAVGHEFVFVEHDLRQQVDALGAASVCDLFLGSAPRPWNPRSCRDARKVASYCDLAISHRLHFAIACLAEGVPAIHIPYNGKAEGAYKMLDVPDLLCPTEEELPAHVEKVMPRLDEFRATLRRALPGVVALAYENLK